MVQGNKGARRTIPLDVARRLLLDLPLSAGDAASRFERAIEPAYWRALCPDLTVSTRSEAVPTTRRSSPADRAHIEHLQRSGYFDAGQVLPPALAARMRDAVLRVRAAGWPAVFSFVYNEFWRVWGTPPVSSVLRGVLGPSYALIPHVWCWCIAPTPDAGGWSPHVDGWNRPNRISIWIALGDATLDNGCMYVVPRDRAADMPIGGMLSGRVSAKWRDWAPLLHGCRALPVAAGSALGWDFQTIHWGSVCHAAGEPRISMAAYFMPRAHARRREERHLFHAHQVPDFLARLWAIGFSTRYFRPNDARNVRFFRLAGRLMRHAGPRSKATAL